MIHANDTCKFTHLHQLLVLLLGLKGYILLQDVVAYRVEWKIFLNRCHLTREKAGLFSFIKYVGKLQHP